MRQKQTRTQATVSEADHDLRLDQFLARRFGAEFDLSRRKFRDLIEQGCVFINGRRMTRLSWTVKQGETVSIRFPERAAPTGWELSKDLILYEDADLIVINKPAGLPSQATLDTSRRDLYRAVGLYLKNKGGDGYAGLHHRLDKDTSGVIALTKSRRANKGLAEQFARHTIKKIYLAVTHVPRTSPPAPEKTHKEPPAETPADSWMIRNNLRKIPGKPARMAAIDSDGVVAETVFSIREKHARGWLVQAEPKTGRMHQIRVHLADQGMPLYGDPLYGDRKLAKLAPRLMLHAHELHLQHPVSGKALTIVAPPPEDMREFLNSLRQG